MAKATAKTDTNFFSSHSPFSASEVFNDRSAPKKLTRFAIALIALIFFAIGFLALVSALLALLAAVLALATLLALPAARLVSFLALSPVLLILVAGILIASVLLVAALLARIDLPCLFVASFAMAFSFEISWMVESSSSGVRYARADFAFIKAALFD
jgi:hypothetical protein